MCIRDRDYADFYLTEWEQLGYVSYTVEDGTEFYMRTEYTANGAVTTYACPEEEYLVQDVITLNAPQLRTLSAGDARAFDQSDFFELSNTIATCLPGWAGTLANNINTIGTDVYKRQAQFPGGPQRRALLPERAPNT